MFSFSPDAADELVAAAESAATRLRGQSAARETVVTQALENFSGGYARAFQNLCVAEVESRGRQAGVLEDLVPQVEEAKRRYQEEKTRRDSLVAWWERETARQESRALASAGGVFIELWDPKPSETPIVPRPLHVAHTCTARSRAASIGGERRSLG